MEVCGAGEGPIYIASAIHARSWSFLHSSSDEDDDDQGIKAVYGMCVQR
jgi:hypothetical protein